MGAFSKAFTPQTSHAAKHTNLWDELMTELASCYTPADLEDFDIHLTMLEMSIPNSWRGSLADQIELKREEIAREDVGAILRDRFDF